MKESRSPEAASKDAASVTSTVINFFTSVRTTITVLFLLAVCAIIGTIIPQGELAHTHGAAAQTFANRLVLILDLNNVYRSWWFTSLLVLLSMNILGCLLKRLPLIVSEWKGTNKKFSFSVKFFDSRSPEDLKKLLLAPIKTILKSNPAIENQAGSATLTWERNRIYLLGFPLIHIAIIIILIGGLIGVFWGFRGHVQIRVGDKSSSFALLSTGEVKELPFTIMVDGFTLTKYPTGEPKEFRSDVRLSAPRGDEIKGSIRVNHPITFHGISLYQSDYRVVGISRVTLTVRREDGKTETFSVNPMEPISIKDPSVEIRIRGFDPGASLRGAGIEISVTDGDQKQRPVRLYERDSEPVKVGGLKLAFTGYEPNYATGLQVGYDPGSRVVWIGSIMLILGFIVTLFTNVQRLQIQLVPEKNRTRVVVSGRSKRLRKEFRESVESIVKASLEKK